MTSKFKTVFGDKKPVIAMVHLGALPGSPLHDYEGGVGAIVAGTYASDMGPWTPDAGKAMRYRDRLGRQDLALLYNVSAEFA